MRNVFRITANKSIDEQMEKEEDKFMLDRLIKIRCALWT